MKKKIAVSILSIAMCGSLTIGATYALFTSESQTNVAITSGTVDVKATLAVAELYSPKGIGTDGVITDETDLAGETFANGGTVKVDGEEITVTNMTPGDKAIFEVTITNNTNVAFLERITLTPTDEDKSFFNELLVGISDSVDGEYTYYSDYATAWEEGTPITDGVATTETMYVSVEMPGFISNKWQGKTCNFALAVNAVQGNAATVGDEVAKTITVVKAADFESAVEGAADGDVIYLSEPVDRVAVEYEATNEVIVRGYKIGDLTVNAPNGTLHVYNNVGTLTGENVAMHSLHVYGEIDNLVINSGRVVVENTAYVDTATIAPSENAAVKLAIPTTVVDGEEVSGVVEHIVVEGLSEGSTVDIIAPETTIIDGEGADDATTQVGGSENSYVVDEAEKILYIGDEVGLRIFADNVNAGNSYAGWRVKLTNDIDLQNKAWTPIGYAVIENNKYAFDKSPHFAGSFDGQEHTISNLYVDQPNTNIQGFFGYGKITEVKNLCFHNASVKGLRRSAVLVGQNDVAMNVSNVSFTGDIKVEVFRNEAGTLVGRGGLGKVENVTVNANAGSYVKCSVTNNSNWEYVGGVWGHAWPSKATNVSSNIDVYSYASSTGGVGGGCASNSENVTCTGNVTLAIKDNEIHKGTIECWQTNGTIYGFGVGSSNASTQTGCSATGTLTLGGEVTTNLALATVASGYLVNDLRFGAPYYAAGVITIVD